MSRPRKFIMGPVVTDPLPILHEVLGGHYVFMNGVPKHPSFVTSMQISTVALMANRGCFALAMPNPNHPQNKKEPQDA
jgi:hypothetical protein